MPEKRKSFLRALFHIVITGVLLITLPLLYVLWRLFVTVVNRIGTDSIRSTDNRLKTPVVFYENPLTQRFVVFIGMIHIGEPGYYAAIQKIVSDCEGCKVLYEKIGELTAEERQALTDSERAVSDQLDQLPALLLRLCKLMSLQRQKDSLVYESSWINTDMHVLELIRHFARRSTLPFSDTSELFTEKDQTESTRWMIDKFLVNLAPICIIYYFFSAFSRKRRAASNIILDARNEIAIRGIEEHLPFNNVVTIWGAQHLSGISRQLRRMGFREAGREWVTAYNGRNYTLFNVGKGVVAAKKAAAGATALKKD